MAISPDMRDVRAQSLGLALLERVKKGVDQWLLVKWPGADETVAMRPLLCDELQESYGAALARCSKLGIDYNVMNADEFHNELAVQVLARSLHTADDRRALLFASGDEMRKVDPDVRDTLINEYSIHARGADPDPTELSQEQFAAIESLVKKKDLIRLSGISSAILASYLIGTASPSES